jgi:hypothetical protein
MVTVRRKHGEKRNVYGVCWEIQKERDQSEDLDIVWDNIKMDLRELEWGGMD